MKKRFLVTLFTLRAQVEKWFRAQRGSGVPGSARLLRRAGLAAQPADFCFQCDGCGCEFVPTPDSFILTGFMRIAADEAENELFVGAQAELLTREKLELLNEFELSEWGLTEEGRQSLLRGEAAYTGADAFCPDCLHQIFS